MYNVQLYYCGNTNRIFWYLGTVRIVPNTDIFGTIEMIGPLQERPLFRHHEENIVIHGIHHPPLQIDEHLVQVAFLPDRFRNFNEDSDVRLTSFQSTSVQVGESLYPIQIKFVFK